MISIDLIRSRETRPIEMTIDEYHSLVSSLTIDPSKLTAPIRLYVDVDGVLLPFIRNEEELNEFSSVIKTSILNSDFNKNFTESFHYHPYHKKVIERVAQLSKNPMIDFVFLTSWNFNAVRSIAKSFGIETAGFLPWALKMSDHNQSFKGVAIERLEEKSPSHFVWIDDLANRVRDPSMSHYFSHYPDLRYDSETGEFASISYEEYKEYEKLHTFSKWTIEDENAVEPYRIPKNSYLSITTNSYSGLTMSELDVIEEWIENKLKELKLI